MALNSSTVSANTDATAAQYNNLRKDVVQYGGDYASSTGSANAYVLAVDAQIVTAYVERSVFKFKANFANTAAATLNVNSLGAKTIKKFNDQDLEANDIESGQVVVVVYDGTNMQMVSPVATQMSSANSATLTGGATSDADALHYHDIMFRDFNQLSVHGNQDELTATVGSGGTATRTYLTVVLSTNWDGNGSTAYIASAPAILSPSLNFTYNIRAKFSSVQASGSYSSFGISADNAPTTTATNTDRCTIEQLNGVYYFCTASGAARTQTDITALLTFSNYNTFKIVRTGASISLYLNGSTTAAATHTTNLPAGTAAYLSVASVCSDATGLTSIYIWNDFVYIQSWT